MTNSRGFGGKARKLLRFTQCRFMALHKTTNTKKSSQKEDPVKEVTTNHALAHSVDWKKPTPSRTFVDWTEPAEAALDAPPFLSPSSVSSSSNATAATVNHQSSTEPESPNDSPSYNNKNKNTNNNTSLFDGTVESLDLPVLDEDSDTESVSENPKQEANETTTGTDADTDESSPVLDSLEERVTAPTGPEDHPPRALDRDTAGKPPFVTSRPKRTFGTKKRKFQPTRRPTTTTTTTTKLASSRSTYPDMCSPASTKSTDTSTTMESSTSWQDAVERHHHNNHKKAKVSSQEVKEPPPPHDSCHQAASRPTGNGNNTKPSDDSSSNKNIQVHKDNRKGKRTKSRKPIQTDISLHPSLVKAKAFFQALDQQALPLEATTTTTSQQQEQSQHPRRPCYRTTRRSVSLQEPGVAHIYQQYQQVCQEATVVPLPLAVFWKAHRQHTNQQKTNQKPVFYDGFLDET